MIIRPRLHLNKWEKFINFIRAYALEIALVLTITAAIAMLIGAGYLHMVQP